MSDIEKAVEQFDNGCACSQAILSVYGQKFGLDPDLALKLSAGFAAGMQTGQTCGAVTGAFMVLGLANCTENYLKKEGRLTTYARVREFSEQFQQRHQSLKCRDLLGCDITTPDGLKTAQEKNLFKTTCTRLVREAAELLEDMFSQPPPSSITGES